MTYRPKPQTAAAMKELREVLRSARPRQGSGVWAAYGRLRDAIYRDYVLPADTQQENER